ncbi:MAG: geranylgeranylglyceryl/heptaprenylglyceryl phosphate synthase [Nitrososphaerota archaeon]|nr:geranylgeranylglyceryl/heptaprenylglyceryl phosphate synthase [Candidatus Calditenuaceae archaeon]MDW8072778.1 geranylgeranylglyceryl/heptaprenylglyceryl phosphate synthase [Nitrososphaerota archaeon]
MTSPEICFRLGKTESYLVNRLRKKGFVHLTLFDPEVRDASTLAKLAERSEEMGTDGFMVGGSTVYFREMMDEAIKAIKSVSSLPVIIFPSNITSVSPHADAIFYMSLLNSLEWWFILGAQIHGSLMVKEYGLEPIPMGYVVFKGETSVAVVGRAFPLPESKPNIVASYALAAQLLGMRLIYLEAGSGAESPIPPDLIRIVRKVVDIPIVVGGGIRSGRDAANAIRAGADIIVTGTLVEHEPHKLAEVVEHAAEAAKERPPAISRYMGARV